MENMKSVETTSRLDNDNTMMNNIRTQLASASQWQKSITHNNIKSGRCQQPTTTI